jgi:hypothetical protein
MALRLSALRSDGLYASGRFLILISVRGWVGSRAILRLEGLGKLKKFTSWGPEHATSRLVAQCLTNYATVYCDILISFLLVFLLIRVTIKLRWCRIFISKSMKYSVQLWKLFPKKKVRILAKLWVTHLRYNLGARCSCRFRSLSHICGADGSVIGSGSLLQVGMLQVRFPMRSSDFSVYLILQPHYGPGVDSASNINEYEESSLGVNGCRRIKLTTLPPSVSRLLRKCEILDIS